MDRAWRIEYEGGLYDVLSLGNERDLLVYLVRKICILSNEKTEHLFGLSYLAISHIVSSMRTIKQKDSSLQVKYNNIY